jgi:hypothetical protein
MKNDRLKHYFNIYGGVFFVFVGIYNFIHPYEDFHLSTGLPARRVRRSLTTVLLGPFDIPIETRSRRSRTGMPG